MRLVGPEELMAKPTAGHQHDGHNVDHKQFARNKHVASS